MEGKTSRKGIVSKRRVENATKTSRKRQQAVLDKCESAVVGYILTVMKLFCFLKIKFNFSRIKSDTKLLGVKTSSGKLLCSHSPI